MPDISLENPWYLLAAVPAVALVVFILRTTSTPLPTFRRALGGAGLAGAVTALLLAACGLFWEVSSERRTVWVLVDRSLSAGETGERRLPTVLQELRNSLPGDDHVGVIVFDENATVALRPTRVSELRDEIELPPWEPTDETYAGTALELAAQQTVPGTAPFAVLIGDGHDSTTRYGGDVVREARDSGVRLFVLPVDSEPLPEVALADFAVRLVGDEQKVLAIDAVVFSTVAQTVIPQVKLNGETVNDVQSDKLDSEGRMRVGVGRNPLRMRVHPREILPSYVVQVSLAAARNTFSRNDSLKLSVRGPGASRVLILHGERGRERALERALGRVGLNVTSGGPGMLPSEMVELSRYQVLVLADVPATAFSAGQLEMIERFTRAGGGLAMIGGPDSYAPGGYHKSAVENVLPVTCDVVEKGRKQRPALVVALDRSGSMGAKVGRYSKMELANEGCVRSIRLVQPGSYFGMLSVDTEAEWIVDEESLDDKDLAVSRARNNPIGGGGIYIDVAMKTAAAKLIATKATTRHLVIFSDGSDTERQEGMLDYARELRREAEITISTICLGRGQDEGFLRDLARVGGGRFFLVQDANDLPAVFSRETALSAGNFLREEPFRPWDGLPGSLTADVAFEAETTPELLGYVAATARKEAHTWLWADEDRERPLLATWNIELGKALAWTSDARDRWSDKWLDWPHFDELWQRWVRWLLPEPGRIHGVESEWAVNRDGPVLNLSFFDPQGNPRELERPVAEIETADGRVFEAAVLPVGSGTYRVQFPRSGSGIYAAGVRERPQGAEQRLVAREHRIFVPLDELMERQADTTQLRAMAEATGGTQISAVREILNVPPEGGYSTAYPYEELLWIAVAGLFLAIGSRRFPSVWRRRVEDRAARKHEEERVATARDAFARVRKQLEERNKPAPVVTRRSDRYEPARPTPPPPNPAPTTRPDPGAASRKPAPDESKPSGEGSLLSAMRKVRNELKDREEGRK